MNSTSKRFSLYKFRMKGIVFSLFKKQSFLGAAILQKISIHQLAGKQTHFFKHVN